MQRKRGELVPGPAGDSASRLRLRRLVWPKGSLSASPQ